MTQSGHSPAAPRRRRRILAALILLLLASGAWTGLRRPSHTRTWTVEHSRLPVIRIDGNRVDIDGVRNFAYDAAGSPTPAWDRRTYDLDRIESVWFVLSPFEKDWRGPAHVFISFGFADSQHVAISVEARRETGEEYSLVKGVLRSYELIYVIGDERDLIGGRAARGDDVFVYPIRASADQVRALFLRMLGSAQDIEARPTFYNTLLNNCTTNIVEHANSLGSVRIPYRREILMPGYADELAVKLGLIDDTASIDVVRARYRVNDRVSAFAADPHFSLRIRELH